MEPRYKHDCESCVFLDQVGKYDLYYHPGEMRTIVARYSSDGPDYLSSDQGIIEKVEGYTYAENPQAFADTRIGDIFPETESAS